MFETASLALQRNVQQFLALVLKNGEAERSSLSLEVLPSHRLA
jgi:hypothetical protein